MFDRLDNTLARYEELVRLLSDPAVIGDQQKYRSLSKEQRDLTPIVEAYTRYRKARADAESLRQIVNSTGEPELRQMAEAELPDAEAKLTAIAEHGAGVTPVPWLQHRHGRDGAAEFFASLQALSISTFVPKALLEGDGFLVALIDLECQVTATGKPIVEEDEVHIWYFNAAGKVSRFRHRVDTHQHVRACQP